MGERIAQQAHAKAGNNPNVTTIASSAAHGRASVLRIAVDSSGSAIRNIERATNTSRKRGHPASGKNTRHPTPPSRKTLASANKNQLRLIQGSKCRGLFCSVSAIARRYRNEAQCNEMLWQNEERTARGGPKSPYSPFFKQIKISKFPS